jgi:hypothetical protein
MMPYARHGDDEATLAHVLGEDLAQARADLLDDLVVIHFENSCVERHCGSLVVVINSPA